jgi:hypothetical protein
MAAIWGPNVLFCMSNRTKRIHLVPGRREWRPFQEWLSARMEPALEAWFGKVEVLRESAAPPPPGGSYIFGYHPHGLFPIGAGLRPSGLRAAPTGFAETDSHAGPTFYISLFLLGLRGSAFRHEVPKGYRLMWESTPSRFVTAEVHAGPTLSVVGLLWMYPPP